MALEIRGYLLRGRQFGEGLEINGGIFPCGETTQSSKHESATVAFVLCFTVWVSVGVCVLTGGHPKQYNSIPSSFLGHYQIKISGPNHNIF